jgi:predicted alpha/beta hydrolase family esterase
VHAPILILPGRSNSGPLHWQTLWQQRLQNASRIDVANWTDPELDEWMSALDQAVETCPTPPILVAHSMGCLLSVWWAHHHRPGLSIAGAFLVAPPNFKREGFPSSSFARIPESPLPVPALVVASTNDPYCPIDVAEGFAKNWETGLVSVGPRGHISTEPTNGAWEEGWHLLLAFVAGLRIEIFSDMLKAK